MVDSGEVKKLFGFILNDPKVEHEKNSMRSMDSEELFQELDDSQRIIEAGDGIRGAEKILNRTKARQQAARELLEE